MYRYSGPGWFKRRQRFRQRQAGHTVNAPARCCAKAANPKHKRAAPTAASPGGSKAHAGAARRHPADLGGSSPAQSRSVRTIDPALKPRTRSNSVGLRTSAGSVGRYSPTRTRWNPAQGPRRGGGHLQKTRNRGRNRHTAARWRPRACCSIRWTRPPTRCTSSGPSAPSRAANACQTAPSPDALHGPILRTNRGQTIKRPDRHPGDQASDLHLLVAGRDLNPRPLGYEPSRHCSTPAIIVRGRPAFPGKVRSHMDHLVRPGGSKGLSAGFRLQLPSPRRPRGPVTECD